MVDTRAQMKKLLAKYEGKAAKVGPPPGWKKTTPPAEVTSKTRSHYNPNDDYYDPVHVLVSRPPKTRHYDPTDGPMAAPGLTSYRYKGRYGWIMIGAKNHQGALAEAKRSTDDVSTKNLQVWDGTSYVPATTKNDVEIETTRPHPRPNPMRDLVWDTVEGVKVLVSEIPNYVAERAPNGTYSVLRLSPRSVVARRLRLKDVMPTIRREHEADVARQVREAERQRLSEAEARAVVDEFENAHGFYVVPGETIGPDGTVYDADGPYYRFERAGYSPDDPEDFSLDDVEDAAVEKMKSLKEYVHSPVKIVEADNAREAAAGRGLLWWEQGLFKGRPADPRQRGFGW